LVENRSRPIKGPAPTFPGNSEEKKFLWFLTHVASMSKFIGFYKVAYWLKSGPFLASNRLRPIRGQAHNISWQLWGKINSFDFWLKSLIKVSVNLSKFMGFYKVAYWLKSGPFLACNRSRPIRGQAPNISWQFWGKKNSFEFWLKSLMLASANLWDFVK
jgi:hypothetical protein